MRRFHSIASERVRKKRKKIWKHFVDSKEDIDRNCNKHHPLNCGNPHCSICKWDKMSGVQKAKYIMEDDRFEDYVNEYYAV